MRKPFYQSPRVRWGLGVLALGGLMGYLWWGSLLSLFQPFLSLAAGQPPVFDGAFFSAILSLGFAIVSVLVTRDLFGRLVSQFALPVNTLEERRQAVAHFNSFATGRPGHAVFVRDGQLVASAEEKRQLSHLGGVILVDSTSGVVLRTDTALTRACGPGVVFTLPGEYLAETLDLRKQTRRQEKVKALTRDGIELTVDVTVSFMLDSGERQPFRNIPDPALPPYHFSEEHALKVGYGKTYRDKMLGEWAELPPLVAADVFRELLIQRDFESLFSATDTGLPLLQGLQFRLHSRLAGLAPDENSREARILSERGIRVLSVSLSNLSLPEEVRQKRLESWKEDWKSQAGEIPDDKDPIIKLWRREGSTQGRVQSLNLLTRFVREQLSQSHKPGMPEVVLSLAAGTRQLLNDPSLQNQQSVADLRGQIESLEIWAQRLGSGSHTPAGSR